MAESSSIAFGKYLRELRERRGLSLARVCELSKNSAEAFDKGTLSRLERGQQSPSIFRLGPISRIYDISADALLERMELDREAERHGAPDTAGMPYAELERAGAACVLHRNRKWNAYVYFRDAYWLAPVERKVPAWLNLATAIRSLGKNALALHELRDLDESGLVEADLRPVLLERISNCSRCLGDMRSAESYGEAAIKLASDRGDGRTLAYAYATRGNVAIEQEEWAVAYEFVMKALAAFREGSKQRSRLSPSPSFESQAMLWLAECSNHLGNVARARRLAQTAKRMSEMNDVPLGVAYAELILGYVDEASGHVEQALQRWRKASTLAARLDNPRLVFAAEVAMFRQALLAGDAARARALRRRLDRITPWVPRYAPAYRRFKSLIEKPPSRDSRDHGGEIDDQNQKVLDARDGFASRGELAAGGHASPRGRRVEYRSGGRGPDRSAFDH
jgi:transcriptional regulator with XRE-family HTH domain